MDASRDILKTEYGEQINICKFYDAISDVIMSDLNQRGSTQFII